MTEYLILPYDPTVNRIEIHEIIGCSDARDVHGKFNQYREIEVDGARSKGTLIEIHRVSVPGARASEEIISECKGLVFDAEKRYSEFIIRGVPVEYYFHLMSHGDARLKEGRDGSRFSYHDIEIHESEFNCGMRQAQPMMLQFESRILGQKPTIIYGRNEDKIQISSSEHLERLMQAMHNHTGTFANWVQSITDIATHSFDQKKELRKAILQDPAIRDLRPHITSGVQNYETHKYYRTDENIHLITIIDRIFDRISRDGEEDMDSRRTAKQKPDLVLFHHGAIAHARAKAVNAVNGGADYEAGVVFAIAGYNAADASRYFGPNKTAGWFMALSEEKFHLQDLVVMGRTPEETRSMLHRLKNDGLTRYMLDEYNPKIIPISEKELQDKKPIARQFFMSGRDMVGPNGPSRLPPKLLVA
jgi:hypothetical protein